MSDPSSTGVTDSTVQGTSFKIGGRLWKIGDSINSTGPAVVKRRDKMVETFWIAI